MKRVLWLFKLWLWMFVKFFSGMLLLVGFLQVVHKLSSNGVFEYTGEDLAYLLKVSLVGGGH